MQGQTSNTDLGEHKNNFITIIITQDAKKTKKRSHTLQRGE